MCASSSLSPRGTINFVIMFLECVCRLHQRRTQLVEINQTRSVYASVWHKHQVLCRDFHNMLFSDIQEKCHISRYYNGWLSSAKEYLSYRNSLSLLFISFIGCSSSFLLINLIVTWNETIATFNSFQKPTCVIYIRLDKGGEILTWYM